MILRFISSPVVGIATTELDPRCIHLPKKSIKFRDPETFYYLGVGKSRKDSGSSVPTARWVKRQEAVGQLTQNEVKKGCSVVVLTPAYATRYLSRHSGEQKCTRLPFTVRVKLVAAGT